MSKEMQSVAGQDQQQADEEQRITEAFVAVEHSVTDDDGSLDTDDAPIDDARAAIAEKFKRQRRQELGLAGDPEQGKEAAGAVAEDEPVTIKVNGKERQVPKSKIDEAGGVDIYQRRAAASEELNAAHEMRRQAEALMRQVNSRAAEIQRQEHELQQHRNHKDKQHDDPPSVPTDAEMKNLARKYHESIMDGDMDAADDLLVRMQTARSGATESIEAVAKQAAELAHQKIAQSEFAKSRREGIDVFEKEYKDIAGDPTLRGFANEKTKEIYSEHPDWEPKRVILEAAEQVSNWVSEMRGGTGYNKPAADMPSSAKLDAKRQLTVIRGGSSARALPRPAPRPQTNSEYVQSLRKARGLE